MFHNKNSAFGKNYFLEICFCVFKKLIYYHFHCVKCVRIRSYSGPYFLIFGMNMERYSVFSPNAKKYGTKQLRCGHFSYGHFSLYKYFFTNIKLKCDVKAILIRLVILTVYLKTITIKIWYKVNINWSNVYLFDASQGSEKMCFSTEITNALFSFLHF